SPRLPRPMKPRRTRSLAPRTRPALRAVARPAAAAVLVKLLRVIRLIKALRCCNLLVLLSPRSHALRGNAVSDAPRPGPFAESRVGPPAATRSVRGVRSHAERGNEGRGYGSLLGFVQQGRL